VEGTVQAPAGMTCVLTYANTKKSLSLNNLYIDALRLLGMQAHVEHDCGLHVVACGQGECKDNVQRRQLSQHDTECSFRRVCCQHCAQEMAHSHWELEAHLAVCPKIDVICECSAGVARGQLREHRDTVCPAQPVACPFSALGCPEAAVPRRALEAHQAASTGAHAALVAARLLALDGRLQDERKEREAQLLCERKEREGLAAQLLCERKEREAQLLCELKERESERKKMEAELKKIEGERGNCTSSG
jgi:hypothetical protein